LNKWIDEKQNGTFFDKLYQKYFIDRRNYLERVESGFLTSKTGKLCPYDDLLKQHAGELPWDWRLLAAQAFQESRFKPDAHSWAGATGLLQLMPATAKQYGVKNALDPEDNVQGAVKFLKWLDGFWRERIADDNERLKFILASYNCGAGHVQDAQRLAEKYGGNPQSWEDVSYWLLQKSTQEYSTDPVVKFGFCRGLEPVNYVTHILQRYDRYKQFLARRSPKSEPQAVATGLSTTDCPVCDFRAGARKSRRNAEGSFATDYRLDSLLYSTRSLPLAVLTTAPVTSLITD
jgi:membrane-bound lytic murein transglycosylase F